jgi:hypothetical protein
MTAEHYRRGAEVELTSVPRGREKRLKVGQRGVIVVAPDGNEFHWASVMFGRADRPQLVALRHLRLVERAAAAQDADDAAPEAAPC